MFRNSISSFLLSIKPPISITRNRRRNNPSFQQFSQIFQSNRFNSIPVQHHRYVHNNTIQSKNKNKSQVSKPVAMKVRLPDSDDEFVISSDNANELIEISESPIKEQAKHVVSSENAVNHKGLPLLEETEYPDNVVHLHREAVGNVLNLHFVESALFCRGRAKAQETAHILVREFARRDKIPLQMTLLHLMRKHNIPRERLFYRSLMFACCKYDDLDWGLFVLENMAHEQLRDVPSMVRLFDSFTACADRRAWHVMDIMFAVLPNLSNLSRWNLATGAILTSAASMVNLGRSTRAKRGFVTLPNPRGEFATPWRYSVNGIQTYYEVDETSCEVLNPSWYDSQQSILQETMLEIEDGTRIKHWYQNTESEATQEATLLLAELVGQEKSIEDKMDRAVAIGESVTVDSIAVKATEKLPFGIVDERLVNMMLAREGVDKTRPNGWADKPRRARYDHVEVSLSKPILNSDMKNYMPLPEVAVLLPNTEAALKQALDESTARNARREKRLKERRLDGGGEKDKRTVIDK